MSLPDSNRPTTSHPMCPSNHNPHRPTSYPLPPGASKEWRIRGSRPDDGARCVEIWADAVDATHDFLSPQDRIAIGGEVAAFLPQAELTLAVDAADNPVAFMLVADDKLEALFVDPSAHGAGAGRALLEHALADSPGLRTDVNEQNVSATGFYEHLGFSATGRSPHDDQGRPYPLIHLQHQSPGQPQQD